MSIDDVRKRAKQLSESFARVAKIKGGHLKDAAQLELALEQLPTPELYQAARTEIAEKAEAWISEVRRSQAQVFQAHLAEFLRKARDAGDATRETGIGWRVGALELEVQPQSARCRALYSREKVVEWREIRAATDFERLVKDARQKLSKAEIDSRILADVLWEAYAARRPSSGGSNWVKLVDLFEELRVVLVRRDVKGSAHRRLKFAEFPKWAALYNLDRYLAQSRGIPEDRRLVPETGSQADVKQGLGCLLNGLDPSVQPMAYCHIRGAR